MQLGDAGELQPRAASWEAQRDLSQDKAPEAHWWILWDPVPGSKQANHFSCYFLCLMLTNVKVSALSQASASALLWWLIASVGKSTEPQPGLESLLSSMLLSP